MEKLLELLREYSTLIEERTGEYWHPIRWWNEKHLTYPIEIMRIKSKEYWFIERLVENDKIDDEKLYSKEYRPMIQLEWESYWELWWTARLLMILSIQDNPLDYLVSILK